MSHLAVQKEGKKHSSLVLPLGLASVLMNKAPLAPLLEEKYTVDEILSQVLVPL